MDFLLSYFDVFSSFLVDYLTSLPILGLIVLFVFTGIVNLMEYTFRGF